MYTNKVWSHFKEGLYTHIDVVITRKGFEGRNIFFNYFDHHRLLGIMPVYHHYAKLEQKMKQSQENDQKEKPIYQQNWPTNTTKFIGIRYTKMFQMARVRFSISYSY